MTARGFRTGEAVRRCRTPGCRKVLVCRVGDACPGCRRAFTEDAPAQPIGAELPPGFVLVGAWPPAEGAA